MRILDLGCGDVKTAGAVGLDRVSLPGVDALCDLADTRYPFPDNTFDEIHLNDVIEHLPDTIKVMEEVHRIAKPGCKVLIRVVNWNSHFTAMDPTHVRAFTENTFDFFGKHPRSYYTRARFEVVKCDLQFNVEVEKYIRNRKWLHFLSRYLCNILEGLNFELKAEKPETSALATDDGTLLSILRCPYCVTRKIRSSSDPGRLRVVSDLWLACSAERCGRKYPRVNGQPVMYVEDAEQWITVPDSELPKNLSGHELGTHAHV